MIKMKCPFCAAPVEVQIQGAFTHKKSPTPQKKEKAHDIACQKCKKPFTVIVPAV